MQIGIENGANQSKDTPKVRHYLTPILFLKINIISFCCSSLLTIETTTKNSVCISWLFVQHLYKNKKNRPRLLYVREFFCILWSQRLQHLENSSRHSTKSAYCRLVSNVNRSSYVSHCVCPSASQLLWSTCSSMQEWRHLFWTHDVHMHSYIACVPWFICTACVAKQTMQ